MAYALSSLLLIALFVPQVTWAGTVKACAEPRLHYLFVHVNEELAGGADQEVFLALAKQTGAQITAVTPENFDAVAKDKYHQGHLLQLLANLKEIRRRIRTEKSERSLDGLLEQRERSVEEIKRLQADRKTAVRAVLSSTVNSIRARDAGTKLVLVYSGHGQRCPDSKEWCAELAPGQWMSESEWWKLIQPNAAVFDASFMATGMELTAAADQNRVYAANTGEWNAEEAGKGLISTALMQLMHGRNDDACAVDLDRNGEIHFRELASFLTSAYAGKIAPETQAPASADDFCIARPIPKKCPSKSKLAKLKFDRLFKHPEVLPPVPIQRAPSSVPGTTKLDKRN